MSPQVFGGWADLLIDPRGGKLAQNHISGSQYGLVTQGLPGPIVAPDSLMEDTEESRLEGVKLRVPDSPLRLPEAPDFPNTD